PTFCSRTFSSLGVSAIPLDGAHAQLGGISGNLPLTPSFARYQFGLSHETSCCIRPPMRHRDASSFECPRHHQRELFSPECPTVRPSSLLHDDIRTCIPQRVRPPPCVPEEERLLCASDKVCARKRTTHNARRLVTAARRGA